MHQSIPFAVRVVCWEQKDHLSDCYFCLTKIYDHNSKSKHAIVYPNIPSAPRLVEHDDSLPNPKPPQQWTVHEENQPAPLPEDEPGLSSSNVDPDFPERCEHLISQSELDLVRDLNLWKIQPEPLASSLQGLNLLEYGVYKESYSQRQHSLSSFLLNTTNKSTIIM
jgi:hypothetical protein